MSEHDVSIDQMAANRGKRVLIEFVAEWELKPSIFIADLNRNSLYLIVEDGSLAESIEEIFDMAIEIFSVSFSMEVMSLHCNTDTAGTDKRTHLLTF